MAAQRLIEYLDERGVSYEREDHPVAYTAQEVAASEHVSGWLVAKTVILRAGGELAMVVLPAPLRVDLDKARAELGSERVELAGEDEFAGVFADCEAGAEPPFGNLYGLPVYVDRTLREDEEIVFRDGTHRGTIRMATDDWFRLVEPIEVEVGIPVD